MVKKALFLSAVVAIAGAARAQDTQQLKETKAQLERGLVAARVPLESPIVGAPYSAQTQMETSQALADGNRISRKTTGRVYRDGSGRIRREEDQKDGTVSISIFDPVAGVSYVLDPQTRIAWKTPTNTVMTLMKTVEDTEQQRAQVERAAAERKLALARARGDEPRSNVFVTRGGSLEKMPEGQLEHRTIEGIPVEGRSASKTIAAGEIGNERPITIVNEEWRSPDLKVLVMTHHNDPRTGESRYQLTNIVRGEPDATLFVVPAGYEIRETGVRREQK
jgi:hypothetical protein